MQNKISVHQVNAWLLIAIVPTILGVIGRNGWLTVLLAAAVCTVVCFCVLSCNYDKPPRWLCVLELMWLTVFLGGFARQSATCWEDANGFPAIPIILLFLAAFAANQGGYRGARTGATLVGLVLPVLGIVFLAGTADIKLSWVRTELEVPDGMIVGLLLLPCIGIFMPNSSAKSSRWLAPVLGLIAVTASILMDGTMGETVAKTAGNSFYEFSKGVSLFGVAERFEAVVACVLTAGWFALLTMILSAVYHLAEEIPQVKAKWIVHLVAIIGAGLMCILPNVDYWMAIGTLIFWGFLPVTAQGLGGAKKLEKK